MAFTGEYARADEDGKVVLSVHFSISAASITGLYITIKNDIDVNSSFRRLALLNKDPSDSSTSSGGGDTPSGNPAVTLDSYDAPTRPPPLSPIGEEKKRKKTAELAASSDRVLVLAILNEALLSFFFFFGSTNHGRIGLVSRYKFGGDRAISFFRGIES